MLCFAIRCEGGELPNEQCSLQSVVVNQTEIAPGNSLTACLLIENKSQDHQCCKVTLELPEGWECLTEKRELLCCLSPSSVEMLLIGIRISPTGAPDDYPLVINLTGLDNSYFDRKIVLTKILPVMDLQLEVEKPSPYLVNTSELQLTHTLQNRGNQTIPIMVDVRTEPEIPLELSQERTSINPGEAINFITDLTNCTNQKLGKHFVFIKIFHQQTEELICQNSFSYEILASHNEKIKLVREIPGHFSVYSLTDNGHQVFAAEFAGGGVINESGINHMDFFCRLPTDTRRNIYGVDQVLFLGFHGPRGYVQCGDAVYSLSPITERGRYARGVGGRFFLGNFELAAFYAKQPHGHYYQLDEGGGSIAAWKDSQVRLGVNYFFKKESDCPEASITTLQLHLNLKNDIHADAEYGYNYGRSHFLNKKHAYRGEISGRFFKSGWFSFEKNHAEPSFLGYITNMDLTSGAFDLPLGKGWRFGMSGNHLDRGKHTLDYCKIFTTLAQRQYNAQLSYHYPCGVNLVATGQIYNSKDLLYEAFDFRQYWAGCNVSWCKFKYQVVGSINVGHNEDLLNNCSHRRLQRYYLYLFHKFRPNMDGYLLAESGHIDYFDVKKWRNGVSGGLRYRTNFGNWWELSANHAVNMPENCSYNRLSYKFNKVFNNQHELFFRSEYCRCKKAPQPKKYLFMLRYTIPLNIPISRRKDRGCLKGRLLHASTQKPISAAVVNVGGQRVITDPNGRFLYHLPVGDHSINVQNQEEEVCYFQQQMVHIQSGKTQVQDYYLEECGDLTGQVVLYDLPSNYQDQLEMLEKNKNGECSPLNLLCQGGVQAVRVTIVNYEKQITFTAVTNLEGKFDFKEIPCGKWVVIIEEGDLPERFVISKNEVEISVDFEEDSNCCFICYPYEYEMIRAK